jgi:hypothetical protein
MRHERIDLLSLAMVSINRLRGVAHQLYLDSHLDRTAVTINHSQHNLYLTLFHFRSQVIYGQHEVIHSDRNESRTTGKVS